jgi:CBS domain-containing protein
MQSYKISEIMVPLSEYATVSEDATLYEAVQELEAAQKNFRESPYKHRAVLVYDKNKKIIGKLGQLDVLKALEPKYYEMQGREGMKSFGFSKNFMKSMLDHLSLLDGAMVNICRKAGETKVVNFVVKPGEGEFVDIDASIDEAIHQLVMGQHQSLLVTDKSGDIVGILRLTDVFSVISNTMHECGI